MRRTSWEVEKLIALYARQSVDKKDSISIETQLSFCRAEAGEHTGIGVYTDKGYSGSNTNRPDFERLLADVREGRIEKVVCYKLDRISRSLLDFAKIIELFNRHEVAFVSCNERFDTSTPIGKAMLFIVMVFAQLERETIQLRVRDNYYARGSKGLYMGGPAPYGFRKIEIRHDGKRTYTFSPDAEHAAIVHRIYDTYGLTEQSLREVMLGLNADGVPAPSGAAWDSCKLSRIMRSPVYVRADASVYAYYKARGCIMSNPVEDYDCGYGLYLYGKREGNERKYTNVSNHTVSLALHEGLVDADLWLRCQRKLDGNRQLKNSGKGRYTWLSGLVKCGYCGYAVKAHRSGGRGSTTESILLRCSGRDNLGICEGFSSLPAAALEHDVAIHMRAKLAGLHDLRIALPDRADRSATKLDAQLAAVDIKIGRIVEQIVEGSEAVTRHLNAAMERLEEERRDLLHRKGQAIPATNPPLALTSCLDDWDSFDLTVKKRIARAFIERVLLYDERLEIHWRGFFA